MLSRSNHRFTFVFVACFSVFMYRDAHFVSGRCTESREGPSQAQNYQQRRNGNKINFTTGIGIRKRCFTFCPAPVGPSENLYVSQLGFQPRAGDSAHVAGMFHRCHGFAGRTFKYQETPHSQAAYVDMTLCFLRMSCSRLKGRIYLMSP